jgi:acyl transferase domain-containing protein
VLPRTLHVDNPSLHIDWTVGNIKLLAEQRPWPVVDRPWRAGVSSFGISGTNAHVVIEQAATPTEAATQAGSATDADATAARDVAVVPWVLSGRTPQALAGQAARLGDFLTDRADLLPVDVAVSLTGSRSVLEHRAVVVGGDAGELLAAVGDLAAGRSSTGVVTGVARGGVRPVFVFPGQGSQWAGMAVGLWDTAPAFAASMEACAQALEPFVDWSLREVLAGDGSAFERVDVVQPALFAVHVSLAALWRAYGVEPAAVIGHSQGEIAAACVAGALSLADAARVVALRSQAIRAVCGAGGMVSLALGRSAAEELIAGWAGRVGVAAVNGRLSTVVSGDADALDELMAHCESAGVRARRVNVDYASHSAHIDRIEAQVLAALAPIAPRAPQVPFFSTVTGAWVDGPATDARYWFDNLRRPVEFEAAVRELLGLGFGLFVESSAHPVLVGGLAETVDDTDVTAAVVGSLRRDEGGLRRFLTSLAEAFVQGAKVDWSAALPAGRVVDLPTYAFQHRRYWLTAAPAGRGTITGTGTGGDETFWSAVERGDVDALTRTVGGDGAALAAAVPALAAWRRQRAADAQVDSWRYRIVWRALDAAPAAPTLSGRWLLVVPDDGSAQSWADTVGAALTGAGGTYDLVGLPAATPDRMIWAKQLAATAAGPESGVDSEAGHGCAGVLSLLPLAGGRIVGHPLVPAGVGATLTLLQALEDAGVSGRLWCLTRGAVSVSSADRVRDPLQAQVWGLGRVAGLELPNRWGGLIDLPETVEPRTAQRLVTTLAGDGAEDQVAVRPAAVFVRRLVPAPLADTPAVRSWRPTGTVLVTGGTGGLGGHVARWLASIGAPHVVLTSRRGPDAPGAPDLCAELERTGTRVTVAACDAADRDAVHALVQGLAAGGDPVTAVVHTAGVPGRYAPLAETTVTDLAEALAAKAGGADALHAALDPAQLDTVVYFSSNAGVWGGAGQGAYAVANAHLDALAEYRRGRGLPTTSIAWGMWAGDGMANQEGMGEALTLRGLRSMDPALAVAALQAAVDRDETTVSVTDNDWPRFAALYTASRPSPLLAELPDLAPADEPAAGPARQEARSALAERLAGRSRPERHRLVLDLVRTEAATVLGHADPQQVDPHRGFLESGFASLSAVELRNRLNQATGLRLPASTIYDQPNPDALARHILAELDPGSGSGGELPDGLGRIEAALRAEALDTRAKAELAERLRDLLRQVDGGWDADVPKLDADALQAASDDEMFALIDQQLGL